MYVDKEKRGGGKGTAVLVGKLMRADDLDQIVLALGVFGGSRRSEVRGGSENENGNGNEKKRILE